jgi:hypothetical protein
MSSHHLEHHDAVVRLGGRVQPVRSLARDPHGREEPDAEVGLSDVVVDGLRDADDGDALVPVQTQRGDRVPSPPMTMRPSNRWTSIAS